MCLLVKRLAWKFRGNERILIRGKEVADEGFVWLEMVGPEKRWMRKSLLGASTPTAAAMLSPTASCSSVLQWAEDSSDCGRSSSSSLFTNTRSCGNSAEGFSLGLYAWRRFD
ncbi:hypothetical protein Ancab_005677 [Ancistrocladus abbreviatus]